MMGLSRGPNARIEGTVQLRRHGAWSTAAEDELRTVRGERIAMVFQDPMTALNPVYKVGDQIVEQIQAHEDVSEAGGARARGRARSVGRHPQRPSAASTTTRTSSRAGCASAR